MSRLLPPAFSGFRAFKFLGGTLGGLMPPEEQERGRRTFSYVALIVLCLFGVLFIRLWQLQLVEGEGHRERSEHNRIRRQDLPPWRGMILGRQGQVLVANRPSYDLLVVPEDVADTRLLARRLGTLLRQDPNQLLGQLEGARLGGTNSLRLRSDLSWEEMALIETYQPELPGVSIQVSPKREYRLRGLAAHILGYLGEISEAQLKSDKFANYKIGDYVGRCGIELAWERYLRGQRGHRRIEVDAYGREFGQLDSVFPTPGANVYLTLDSRLQQEAETCLEGKVGAIVALDPRSGRILAMASSPTYSQEAFERGLTSQEWQRLSSHRDHPLENRALNGQYPPGSTFKIVMALAGLEERVITPQTVISCSGALPFGNHVFHCWNKRGHGGMNLHSALVNSCDVYFYTVGRRLGIERIAKWSRRFGLGAPSGLQIDREMSGLVASPAWKLARFGQPWQEGDTLSVAIGQGYNLTTPLQMAQVMATIANGGNVFTPQLVERVESPASEVLFQAQPTLRHRLEARPANVALVQKALFGVVDVGTGRAARLTHIKVAGKTGTSQVVSLEREKKAGRGAVRFQNHAWFVAYAPVEDPQIAVAVIVEHGGGGGAVAAPLARRILNVAFPEPRLAHSR
jgi:penicillin-binding protein 2